MDKLPELCLHCNDTYDRRDVELLADGSGYKHRYASCQYSPNPTHRYSIDYRNYDQHLHRLGGKPAEIVTVAYLQEDVDVPGHKHVNRRQVAWWENGYRHRLDGPAILTYDMDSRGGIYIAREYFIEGEYITYDPEVMQEFIKYCNLPFIDKVHLKLMM